MAIALSALLKKIASICLSLVLAAAAFGLSSALISCHYLQLSMWISFG